jgi:hypothetical protein
MKAKKWQRRYVNKQNAKMPNVLTEVARENWPSAPSNLLRVWRSRFFLVQEYQETHPDIAVRLTVSKTTFDGKRFADGITFEELQKAKTECGYGHHEAVEIYPRDLDVVNVAPMRHLWVMRDRLGFGWTTDPANPVEDTSALDGIPRRARVDRHTPAETAIRKAKMAVEAAGCDPLLTDAVVLLGHAQNKVADFVDGQLINNANTDTPTAE